MTAKQKIRRILCGNFILPVFCLYLNFLFSDIFCSTALLRPPNMFFRLDIYGVLQYNKIEYTRFFGAFGTVR